MTFDEIVDLAVDENFEVFIDHRGDLGAVKGRDAFEQRVIIRLTEKFQEMIGMPNVDNKTIINLAEEYIKRVAEQEEQLERVEAYDASFSDENHNVLEIEVIYDTGTPLTFDIES